MELWRPYLVGGVLLASRVAGMVLVVPWWGARAIPPRVRLAAVLAITVVLLPGAMAGSPLPSDLLEVVALVPVELLVGAGLGLAIGLVLAGISSAGRVAAMQIGLRMANVLDPAGGHQGSVVDALLHGVCILAMLAMDLHHTLLRGLVRTLELLPLGGSGLAAAGLKELASRGGQALWVLCVQVAGPIIGVAMLMHVAFAVLLRFAPQMNVFFVAFSLVILVGLVFLAGLLPAMMERVLAASEEQMIAFFTLIGK